MVIRNFDEFCWCTKDRGKQKPHESGACEHLNFNDLFEIRYLAVMFSRNV